METNIKTVFIDEKTEGTSVKRFDIAFSTKVKTYINDFPSFNFASFLAATGGAIGLWLGLGVQQILDQLSPGEAPYGQLVESVANVCMLYLEVRYDANHLHRLS